MSANAEFFMRYVAHNRVEAYRALGWQDASGAKRLGLHGYWSQLMKWPHAGDPVEPAPSASGKRLEQS